MAGFEYRTSSGEVLTLAHGDFRYNGDALLARGHLMRTAKGALELGAWCGFGGALLCLALRAGILHWQEALLWEKDTERREWIIERVDAGWEQIDDRLSGELVVERTDRHGRTVLPWLHSGGLPLGRTEE